MIDLDLKMCVNGDIKIKHTYIDFCPLIFQRKMDYLLMSPSDKKSEGRDMEISWL